MMEKMLLVAAFSLMLLCAGIGGLVLLYLWLISYVSLLQRRRRRRPSEDNAKFPEQQGLSAADLQRLPTFEYHEEEGEERRPSADSGGGNAECVVCLDAFQIGDRCRVIPACSHTFHVQCADAWLSKRSVCPICRTSARESKEKNGVNGGAAAAALPEESGRDHDQESGRRHPPPPAESIVIDMPIAITGFGPS